jgi:hypothetical protein
MTDRMVANASERVRRGGELAPHKTTRFPLRSLLKHPVIAVTARQQVRHQIEDLILLGDGRWLDSGGLDGTARIWDPRRTRSWPLSRTGARSAASPSAPTARAWRPAVPTTPSASGTWRRSRTWRSCAATGRASTLSAGVPTGCGWPRPRATSRSGFGKRFPLRTAPGLGTPTGRTKHRSPGRPGRTSRHYGPLIAVGAVLLGAQTCSCRFRCVARQRLCYLPPPPLRLCRPRPNGLQSP